MERSFKGILYPTRLPDFHRIPAPDIVAHLVQWFWIPEWDIEPGRTSRQQLIAYPTSNLVVLPSTVEFAGPATRASHRDLTGRGWAVGALLRPALVPHLIEDPGRMRDRLTMLPLPELQSAVSSAMAGADPETRRRTAVGSFVDWLVAQHPEVSEEGERANRMMHIIATDADVRRIDDISGRLSVSSRTLQRIARKYVGLSPSELIRRRRLQDAAERVRTDPVADLAALAAELGYADHAHLTNDFRMVLGFTPSDYRRSIQS
ncbi:AraC family transcriptional regulator [Rathayibacter soli]|uniref:AraC family transcriptional regulator n=1 Tax=Rathayibacter soli TaxID=3144168 RepID=UPI0027E5BD8D|nr:helix-turn-helix domain-containing protein [Glaciibacter superstes]